MVVGIEIIKIVGLSWKLLPTLIRICRVHFFCFWPEISFLGKFCPRINCQFKGALSGLKQYLTIESPLKSHLKSFFRSKDMFFFLTFWSCIKTTWLERSGWFQILWRHSLVSKQLYYTFCPVSRKVTAIAKWEKHFSWEVIQKTCWRN